MTSKSSIDKFLSPPITPMKARAVKSFPIGKEWMYEPKWDGFRCLIFRDEENIFLQSRTGKSLAPVRKQVSTPTVSDILPNPRSASKRKSAVYGLNGHRLYYIISLFKVAYKSTIQALLDDILWTSDSVCRVGRDDLANNQKTKRHPHRSELLL